MLQLRYRLSGSPEVLKIEFSEGDTFRKLRRKINHERKLGAMLEWRLNGDKIEDDIDVSKSRHDLSGVFDVVPVDEASKSHARTGCLRLRGTRGNVAVMMNVECYMAETIGSVRKVIESEYFRDMKQEQHVLIAHSREPAFDDDVLIWDLDLSDQYCFSFTFPGNKRV